MVKSGILQLLQRRLLELLNPWGDDSASYYQYRRFAHFA
jgi:hypothetical protein